MMQMQAIPTMTPSEMGSELVKSNKVYYSEKALDALTVGLSPETRILVLEGAIRSSKTVTLIECFYYAVKESTQTLHCIAGRDYDALRDTIIETEVVGLMTRFSDVEMKKSRIGGYYLTVMGYDGRVKRILLCGYSTKDKWKKILGKTLGVILIDECNTSSKQFIDESFARQASADRPLTLMSLNGDYPSHWIYTEYINYCKPLGNVPVSILRDMNKVENKPGYFYFHFTMHDNPIMTPEKIANAENLYPKGSYYFLIKILGERGVGEGLIYPSLADSREAYTIEPSDRMIQQINRVVLGVDFGGNGSGHAFCAIGTLPNYRGIVVLRSEWHKATNVNVTQLTQLWEAFVNKVWNDCYWIQNFECYCDSAEQTIINEFDTRRKQTSMPVSVFNAYKDEIQNRIRTTDFLLAKNAIYFVKGRTDSVMEALCTCRWNTEKGQENRRLDDGTSDIDSVDAFEYTIEELSEKFIKSLEMR